ncbi:flavin-binding monooxygenase [Colletotrichum truncatum]|uniref:Flavin-binding monooxygenase n=1 Tax=Colletotrichum truncatum TaxID=5467 RepID=A0ACC3YUT7_COLTU|nr:flavin-binding monooxygenase [Colletotrichum truncatum]KAF6785861.1 flavin-binding monooxygenase [Colletotrichum truncatum]
MAEELDVLILGAGISGINAAYRVRTELPQSSFAVLEARDIIGGTWSYWKYPGFRSDSNMTNFGFGWHPWPHNKKIIEGAPIAAYIEDAVKTHGIDKHIRFRHKVVSSSWDTDEARWTVTCDTPTGEKKLKAKFLFMCSGYYSYEKALDTQIPGIDKFQGQVIHPQWWPEDLDYTGKRVIIVGSGATSMTLFPNMAKNAGFTTILQRSPSYVFALSPESGLDKMLKLLLPLFLANWIILLKDLLLETIFIQIVLNFPDIAKRFLRAEAKRQLPKDYPVDVHFNPVYNPFQQRLNMSPDGDVFKALHQPNTEIVTDHIETVTADGILTKSGRHLPADIIITATGLHVQLFSGTDVTVDGVPVKVGEKYCWRGCMLDGVPNAAAIMGYVTQTWTPGADTVTRLCIRVIKQMQQTGAVSATPILSDEEKKSAPRLPCVDATSNYFKKAHSRMPVVTNRGPWYGRTNLIVDKLALWFGSVTVGMDYRLASKSKDI